MVNISTKFHEDTTIVYEAMARTRHKLHIFDLWPLSMTLTFDIESWVLYATSLLIIIKFLTKLYENATTITFEVTARTRSDGRTSTQKLQIVVTKSRSPQAGSTKMGGFNFSDWRFCGIFFAEFAFEFFINYRYVGIKFCQSTKPRKLEPHKNINADRYIHCFRLL